MSRIRTAALAAALAALAAFATTPAIAGETSAAAPAKKAATSAKKAAVERTDAAPAAEHPAAPAVIGSVPDSASTAKKIDPLAAALARAAAAPTAKTTAAPAAKTTAEAKAHGLADLHDTCRRNAKRKLLGRHSEKVPSGEVVMHMKAVTLDQDQVSAVINHQLSQLQYCYENLIARGKRVDDNIGLHFVVEPKGNVSSTQVHSAGPDSRLLETCVARRVKRWRFPAADAPTLVDYPLMFESNTTN